MTEAHPNEGECKTKVSCKSTVFRAELTEKNRSIIAVYVTIVCNEVRSANG